LSVHVAPRPEDPERLTQWAVQNTTYIHLKNLCAQKIVLPGITKVNVYLGSKDEGWDGDKDRGFPKVHQLEPPGLFDFSDPQAFQLKLLDLIDKALRKVTDRLGVASEPLDAARAQTIASGFETEDLVTRKWLHNASKTLSARVWMRSQFGHVDIVCETKRKKATQTHLLMQFPPAPLLAFTCIKRVEWEADRLRLVVRDMPSADPQRTVFGYRTYDISGASLAPTVEKSRPEDREIVYSYPIPALPDT
jgi:hypothetical protein